MSERSYFRLMVVLTITWLLGWGCSGDPGPFVHVGAPQTDSVWVRIIFGAGSAYDPDSREGLAHLTAAALEHPQSPLFSDDERQHLRSIGAHVEVWVDRDVCVIDGYSPTESWQDISEFLVSLVAAPSLDTADLTRLVFAQLTALGDLRNNEARLAREALQYRLYPDHPYGHPPEGLEGAVQAITADDVQQFWSGHYTRGNFVCGIAGDISRRAAERFHKTLTEALPPGERAHAIDPAPPVEGMNLYLIEMGGTGAKPLVLGRPMTVERDDLAFPSLYAANAYLGRHGGYLAELLDVRRDLSFVSWSYLEHTEPFVESDLLEEGRPRRHQYMSIETQPAPINTAFTLQIVLTEMDRMRKDGIPSDDLDRAREFLFEETQKRTHPAHLMHQRLDDKWLGRTVNSENISERLSAVTLANAQKIADATYDPRNIVIVAIVPSGQAVASQLMRGQVSYVYPEGVNRRNLRMEDNVYLTQQWQWHATKMRIVEAGEMFR